MRMNRDWKHYYLEVGTGCNARSYYTSARSESEARSDARKWASDRGYEGTVRVQRKKTKREG